MLNYKEGEVKIIDIETNGLLQDMLTYKSFPYKLNSSAKIWVVSIRDYASGKAVSAVKEQITKEWLKDNLKGAKIIVAHNGIKFDFLALKLFGLFDYKIGYLNEDDTLFGEKVKFIDTLILSRLFNPDREGGHSLGSYGKRVGNFKTDFRQVCIDKGYILKTAPEGAEFKQFCPEMVEYCEQDVTVNAEAFTYLAKEKIASGKWDMAIKQENKLADLGIKREHLGFWFNKELAISNFNELTSFMNELEKKILPNLPLAPLTKVEQSFFNPPKNQFKKDGTPDSSIIKFAEKHNGKILVQDGKYFFQYKEDILPLPLTAPIETLRLPEMKDNDHIKQTLIDVHGWVPTEWRIRDLTADTQKKKLPYKKRVAAFKAWLEETLEGKYKELRLQIVFKDHKVNTIRELTATILEKLHQDFPVRVPTSPPIRVGVAKDLCPNLVKLGENVEFAKWFADYSTYSHRRSSIAGGKGVEDLDLWNEKPEKGFLTYVRDEDGRIPTPAIEIGASTTRYRHAIVVNVPRPSSLYGEKMRAMFGAGKGFKQFGFDYSSLENRIQGHYILPYPNGKEEAAALVAEKPNDAHSILSTKLNIPRDVVKSIFYGAVYGGSYQKIGALAGLTGQKAKDFYDDFWNSVPALKALKASVEKHWEEKCNKEYIPSLDGRRIRTRSKHSLLNALFQSSGVIFAKYVQVLLFEKIEKEGYVIDPFENVIDICSMSEVHDELQLSVNQRFTILFENKDNFLTKLIDNSIKDVEKILSLRVEMGYDWDLGDNWADCH